jgi:hypothetical protein
MIDLSAQVEWCFVSPVARNRAEIGDLKKMNPILIRHPLEEKMASRRVAVLRSIRDCYLSWRAD